MIQILKDYQTRKDAGLIDHVDVTVDPVTQQSIYRIWVKQWNPDTGEEAEPRVYAISQTDLVATVTEELAIVNGAALFVTDVDPVSVDMLPIVNVKPPKIKGSL